MFLGQNNIPGFPRNPTRISLRSTRGSFDRDQDRMVPNGSLFFKVASDTLNNTYIVGEDYSICPQRDVFILDHNGILTAILELPRESDWLFIDSRQYLWSIEGQRMRLCKYRIFQ
jgi:hypothetical protein